MERKRKNNRLVMVGECFRMSISNIMNNRMRSFLTVLGILIGVTAIIALMTTVGLLTGFVKSTFSNLGAGTLNVSITGNELKSGLDKDDQKALLELDCVDGIVPSVSLKSRISRDDKYDTGIAVSGKNAFYFRKTPDIVKRGRPFNVIDEDNMSRVCLINDDITEKMFYGEDPIGKNIYVDGYPFTVVGTINKKATKSISDMLIQQELIIPYTTAQRMKHENLLTSFSIYIKDGIETKAASKEVENALDAMFSYKDNTYTITSMDSIEDIMTDWLGLVSTLLTGIASIALLVGGIGIMNMMLTTVSERTVEIGLKKALGAHSWHIQLQFLIESFTLSVLGGLIGIILGILFSLVFSMAVKIDFILSPDAIILGFSFSAAVGIIFGWAPARKASRLNPIDALRTV